MTNFCRISTKVQIYRQIVLVQNIKFHGTLVGEAGTALRYAKKGINKPTACEQDQDGTAVLS